MYTKQFSLKSYFAYVQLGDTLLIPLKDEIIQKQITPLNRNQIILIKEAFPNTLIKAHKNNSFLN